MARGRACGMELSAEIRCLMQPLSHGDSNRVGRTMYYMVYVYVHSSNCGKFGRTKITHAVVLGTLMHDDSGQRRTRLNSKHAPLPSLPYISLSQAPPPLLLPPLSSHPPIPPPASSCRCCTRCIRDRHLARIQRPTDPRH
jgi:hypothetical protein